MYKIDLEEILALNNLPPGAFIFPGDELLIKAPEATPTATEVAELGLNLEAESTVTPTVTRRPKRTLTPAGDETDIAGISTQVTAEVDELAKAPDSSEFTLSGLFLIIAILVLGGTGLIILGNMLNRSG